MLHANIQAVFVWLGPKFNSCDVTEIICIKECPARWPVISFSHPKLNVSHLRQPGTIRAQLCTDWIKNQVNIHNSFTYCNYSTSPAFFHCFFSSLKYLFYFPFLDKQKSNHHFTLKVTVTTKKKWPFVEIGVLPFINQCLSTMPIKLEYQCKWYLQLWPLHEL